MKINYFKSDFTSETRKKEAEEEYILSLAGKSRHGPSLVASRSSHGCSTILDPDFTNYKKDAVLEKHMAFEESQDWAKMGHYGQCPKKVYPPKPPSAKKFTKKEPKLAPNRKKGSSGLPLYSTA